MCSAVTFMGVVTKPPALGRRGVDQNLPNRPVAAIQAAANHGDLPPPRPGEDRSSEMHRPGPGLDTLADRLLARSSLLAKSAPAWTLDHADLVVEPLDERERDLVLRPAVGGNAVPMTIDHLGKFLVGLDPLPSEVRAPVLEEAPSPAFPARLDDTRQLQNDPNTLHEREPTYGLINRTGSCSPPSDPRDRTKWVGHAQGR
jgi:hypothetical protein